MYWWQIVSLVVIACLAAINLMRPVDAKGQKLLWFLLAWVSPYLLVTLAFCTMFLQGAGMSVIFFAAAAACFLTFLKRKPC